MEIYHSQIENVLQMHLSSVLSIPKEVAKDKKALMAHYKGVMLLIGHANKNKKEVSVLIRLVEQSRFLETIYFINFNEDLEAAFIETFDDNLKEKILKATEMLSID